MRGPALALEAVTSELVGLRRPGRSPPAGGCWNVDGSLMGPAVASLPVGLTDALLW